MTLKKRIESPTPDLFKKIRRWGLIITTVSGAIITAPVKLPELLVTVSGYMAVAGAVATAVSQIVTGTDLKEDDKK